MLQLLDLLPDDHHHHRAATDVREEVELGFCELPGQSELWVG